jgi:hypothetical protein
MNGWIILQIITGDTDYRLQTRISCQSQCKSNLLDAHMDLENKLKRKILILLRVHYKPLFVFPTFYVDLGNQKSEQTPLPWSVPQVSIRKEALYIFY